jgi:hypothetical protein
MKQKEKLDQLILRILKEETNYLNELSPKLKQAARAKVRDKINLDRNIAAGIVKMPSGYNFSAANKKYDQNVRLTHHIDPEVKKAANKIAQDLENETGKEHIASFFPDEKEGKFIEIMFIDLGSFKDEMNKKKTAKLHDFAYKYIISKDDINNNNKPLPSKYNNAIVQLADLIREKELEGDESVNETVRLIRRIMKEELKNDNPLAGKSEAELLKYLETIISDPAKAKEAGEIMAQLMNKPQNEVDYAGKSALSKAKQDPNYLKLSTDTKREVDKALISGKKVTLESEETTEKDQPELQEGPCGSCIAGQLNELMDNLKALSEAAKDVKHKKYADKTMKYLDAAKTALESVVAHEAMLEEKSLAEQTKLAEKHLKEIRKNVSKKIKDEAIVEKIMSKMNPHSIMAMKKKKGGELDEEKVAGAMLNVAMNENFIPKTSLNEGKIANIIGGIAASLATLGATGGLLKAMQNDLVKKQSERDLSSAVYRLEDKLNIKLNPGEQNASMRIDSADWSKIDSLYDNIIKKYPEYELKDSKTNLELKLGAGSSDKPYLGSVIRAMKLSSVASALADHSKEEKDSNDNNYIPKTSLNEVSEKKKQTI